jgi:hypothetical protein
MAHRNSRGWSRFVVSEVCALVLVAWAGPARAGEGLIVAPESIVRTAPFEVAPEIARLHAGDKLSADDKPTGAWRRVRLADGRFGLVHDADIQVLLSATPIAGEPAPAPPPQPAPVASPPGSPEQPSDFGAENGLVLSTERLFGYVHTSLTNTIDGVDLTENTNSFALFSNPLSATTIYSSPRIAVDTFTPYHVSIGGSLAYFHVSDQPPGAQDEITYSGFLIAPRVGYSAVLGPKVYMWPRVGFTLMKVSVDSAGVTVSDSTYYALTVEVPILFIVAPHVFLSLAPTLDVGLGGSASNSIASSPASSMSNDQTVTSFGFLAGFGAFF